MNWLRSLIALTLLINGVAHAQLLYPKTWSSIGPNEPPSNTEYRNDAGVGPVEFIRVYQKEKGYLLAGSLSGGLFYSNDGGASWSNAGSDHWDYTGCPWADFHPNSPTIWFACSNFEGDNGKPGRLEDKGGVLRSLDAGKSWQMIGNVKHFGGSGYLKIYGTRFHPSNPNVLFVLTSEGIYFTRDCMASYVKWRRVPNIKGWVYDLDFLDGSAYISNFYHGKWNVISIDLEKLENGMRTRFEKLACIEKESRPMRNLTIEPIRDELLIAKDFKNGQDEVIAYHPTSDSCRIFLENQRISFGSGYTFAASPHDSSTVYFGYATQLRKWSYPEGTKKNIGRKYHVDIEFIAFDPFDSSTVFIATHGGVFVSHDAGQSWSNTSHGLSVAEVMGLAVSNANPNQVAIGCYHDGSMVRADFEQNGQYQWRTVNGGDGLLPLIHPSRNNIVYTSNQYVGGGLYFATDTAKNDNLNLHRNNGFKTSGWEMAAVMDSHQDNTVFFNFLERKGINKGNINVARISEPDQPNKAEVISDFNASHGLESYKVYGLYNSPYHPQVLIAYVLHFKTDEHGKKYTEHLLFRTDQANASGLKVMKSWYSLEHPNNTWLGDVEIDHKKGEIIYVSYTRGKEKPETIFGDRGMVYRLQYRTNESHQLKKEIDISRNIPISLAGRYNMCFSDWRGGTLFIATRTGVYMANGKTLKGKSRWHKVGQGLPHCKVYGIDFVEAKEILTVGYFGRGVWQYQF